MLGLAQMAARLAYERSSRFWEIIDDIGVIDVASRAVAERAPHWSPTSAEYYKICDHIERGEKP